MAAKLQCLVVTIFVCAALATNASTVKNILDTITFGDRKIGKGVADAFEEALRDEEPGLKDALKEEELGSKEAAHQSALRTRLRSHKGKPAESMSLSPDQLGGGANQFEKDVSDLIAGLSKDSFAGTPMGASVGKVINLIENEMMPQVIAAHEANQKELNSLNAALQVCGTTKTSELLAAEDKKPPYTTGSVSHKTCRGEEASLYTENVDCHKEWQEAKEEKELKCKQFAYVSNNFGEYIKNQDIMKKAASEDVQTYLKRISDTICGKPLDCSSCESGGGGESSNGFLDIFEKHKKDCEDATKVYNDLTTKCKGLDKDWHEKRTECDLLQDTMDNAACAWNIDVKDACESYSGCFHAKKGSYDEMKATVVEEEKDRKAEWRGLKRMLCIIKAFGDGKVELHEIDTCKAQTHPTDGTKYPDGGDSVNLDIAYPVLDVYAPCTYTQLFPTTAEYKQAEFDPLPTLAKGKLDANPCSALKEVSTTPRVDSPPECKCERVIMDGPWSAGALVKCSNCIDVSSTEDKNSCPIGTKLFSPRSRQDWETFIKSAPPLREPNWIVDITRRANGCSGCETTSMNSGEEALETWVTQDGSPWWLRSTVEYSGASDYLANCYLDLTSAVSADTVTFKDEQCNYHSKSYYCQPIRIELTPNEGSPEGCVCKKVELLGEYSASNILIRCEKCLDVSKSTDTNSCPKGTKIFSPRTRADWKTFIASAVPLRSPHWIIDVTRPQNGCGGCTEFAMKSSVPAQATWHTSDDSPWWLRDTAYTQPTGDYTANCYMDLWHKPPNENSVSFDDSNCDYHSRSYYCQAVQTTTTTTTTTEAPLEVRIAAHAYDHFLDALFSAALRMMLPKDKETLGPHCFRYAALTAREFYFPETGAPDVLQFKAGSNAVAVKARGGFEKIMAGRPEGTRVTLGEFLTTVGEYRQKQGLEEISYGSYMGAVFDAAGKMMIPAETTLGSHCFGAIFVLSQEFYWKGGDDTLGLEKPAPEGADAALVLANTNANQDWSDVPKDSDGRVSRTQFKQFFMSKFSLPPPNQVTPPVPSAWVTEAIKADPESASAISLFENFLELVFTAGLRMMLPNSKETLGGHCFRYAALMADEFYFPVGGLADVLEFKKGTNPIAYQAAQAFHRIEVQGRVTLGGLLTDIGGMEGGWLQELSFGTYIASLFDAATHMMIPAGKDVGVHCFGILYVLSKEFYFNEEGKSKDHVGLEKAELASSGLDKADPALVQAHANVNEAWNAIPKDAAGRVTRDAFKQHFMEKASAAGKFKAVATPALL